MKQELGITTNSQLDPSPTDLRPEGAGLASGEGVLTSPEDMP